MPDAEQVVYRPKEAMARLRVSKTTLYRWLDEGTIPSFRVRRSLFIPVAAIDELLKSAAAGTLAKAA